MSEQQEYVIVPIVKPDQTIIGELRIAKDEAEKLPAWILCPAYHNENPAIPNNPWNLIALLRMPNTEFVKQRDSH